MKILLTTPLFPPEIAEPAPYSREVSTRLSVTCKVAVLTYSNIESRSDNPKIIRIKKNQSTISRLLKYFTKLYIESRNCDLIFAQCGISTSLASLLVAFIRRKTIVFRYSEDEAWERSKRLRMNSKDLGAFLDSSTGNFKLSIIKYLQTLVLKNSSKIIVPSVYFQKLLSEHYQVPLQKIKIIYNPAPKEIFIPLACEKLPESIFTSAEYLNDEDLDILINACSELQDVFPNLRLKISGASRQDKYDRFDFIDWLGFCSEAEKFFQLKTSVIHIINSSVSYNPDALYIGFQTDTATICSNVEGLNEAIVNNESGLLLDTGEAEELKEKIRSIFLTEELKERLQNGAKQLLKSKFSWETHIKELENIFHE